MRRYLELISVDDTLPLVVLIAMLSIINAQLTRPDAAAYRHARRAAAGMFAAYAVLSLVFIRIHSAGELLLVVVRCCLASGLTYGVTALILGALTATVGDPILAIYRRYRAWRESARSRRVERQRKLHAAQAEQRERDERRRRAPQEEEARRQHEESLKVAEQQRMERVQAAESAVTRYYEAHADLLEDTLPQVLFESRMQTKFPESLTPEKAWETAQEMLAEMLPTVSAAKAKRQEEHRKTEQVQNDKSRRQKTIERLKEDIENITTSPGFEPDVSGPEVRAIREQIRELELEIENLECGKEQP